MDLRQADQKFAKLGAVTFHDSNYPERDSFGRTFGGGLFSRHYFAKNGLEIGYVIPDLLRFEGHGIHVLEQPRMWGIPRQLQELVA